MALSLLNRNNRIINMELKDHVIRFVELKQNNSPIVHKCSEYKLPAGIVKAGKIEDFDTLKEIVEQCIAKWKIAKRQVRFLIPDQTIVLRKITIDKDISDDEIIGHLYLQLGTSIHLPFEEPVFDVFIIGEKEDKKEILLFAASDESVYQYSQLFEQCKLKPIVADISSLAMYRLYNAFHHPSNDEHIMFLHVDLYNITISTFTEHRPNFMRNITIPVSQDLWELTMSKSGIQQWEFQDDREYYFQSLLDTYKEIEKVLTFYKYTLHNGNHEISKIVVSGDHPFLDTMITDFRERLEIEIQTINQENIIHDQYIEGVQSYFLPIGLALRGGE